VFRRGKLIIIGREERVRILRGQSRIRYSLPPTGFSESGIHLARATGKLLGLLWIHVQGFPKWAKQILDSGFLSSLRGFPTNSKNLTFERC